MKNTDALPARVHAFAAAHAMFPHGGRILCALSGGADSMAMLTALLTLSRANGFAVSAAHYNHQLRGTESLRDERFVSRQCAELGVPLIIGRGAVAQAAEQSRTGIEETARRMRYAFLEEAARSAGADRIATAHNADDNAETVLLHLVRGTGLDGLTGIPPCRGRLIRPLLGTTRAEIEQYLAENGIAHVEDSTNSDTAYARNRLRREVMPVLRSINPNFSHTLAECLPRLNEERQVLDSLAENALAGYTCTAGTVTLDAARIAALPPVVAARCIKRALERLDCYQISAAHLNAAAALAGHDAPSASVDLPHGITARREYGRLILTREDVPDGFAPVPLPPEGILIPETGWQITCVRELCPESPLQSRDSFLLPEAALAGAIVRPRKTGDTLRLPGRREKSLKKWFIDEKIPRRLRDTLPVLANRHGVIAAALLGADAAWQPQPGCPAVRITFIPPRTGNEE